MVTSESRPLVGLYRSGITDTKRLIETTIGREEMLAEILAKLRNRGKKKSGINRLYIGPRGVGKTHLLSLIEHGIESDADLQNGYTVVRFPEEPNRILSFADLLLGIVEILESTDQGWANLYRELYTQEQDELIVDTIMPRLKQYYRETGKCLLVMLENLDAVLTQQIKSKTDIHRLRSLLMDNAHIVMVATSPIFFPALNDIKHPLYDFFDIEVIEDLTRQQTLDLIFNQIQWDRKQDLLEQYESLEPKILALHEMTGGNPRLIMMLYRLIAQNSLLDVKDYFHHLLDNITPFYQDRIKDLPPQERALLETLALMRDPSEFRTPVNIAKRMRKSVQQTSTLLKRMTDAGYLRVGAHPKDKRSRIYRIKEGFFDLWLAMNESRGQRKYLPYLVEFFHRWYNSQKEREIKRREFTEKIEAAVSELEKKEALEHLAYLSETGKKPEREQAKLTLAVQQIKAGVKEESLSTLQEIALDSNKLDLDPLFIWMRDQTLNWASGERPEPGIHARMEKIIQYWSEQRIGELETVSRLVHDMSLDFSGSGLHKLNIALLEEQMNRTCDPREKIHICFGIVASQLMDGQLNSAIKKLEGAVNLANSINDRGLEGSARDWIGQIYYLRGHYESALSYLNQSLVIRQEIGDKSGEGTTLNNISTIYHALGDYETARRYLKQSFVIQQKIGNKYGEGTTLNNMATAAYARGDYKTALRYLERSLAITQEIGDKFGEGTTLNNISQIYDVRGDSETALRYLKQSLVIRQEIGDAAGLCNSLFNIGHIHWRNGEHPEALSAWLQVYHIAKSIGLAEGLNALTGLADQLGLEGRLDAWEKLAQQQNPDKT